MSNEASNQEKESKTQQASNLESVKQNAGYDQHTNPSEGSSVQFLFSQRLLS